MGDKKKIEKIAKSGEQKCLKKYKDRYGIWHSCQRKKGHFPLKCC